MPLSMSLPLSLFWFFLYVWWVCNIFSPKIMQGFNLKENKIMRKIFSSDNFKGENQNSSEAKKESPSVNQASARCFYHQTKKYEVIIVWILQQLFSFTWILFLLYYIYLECNSHLNINVHKDLCWFLEHWRHYTTQELGHGRLAWHTK